jgi:uncharacterized protein
MKSALLTALFICAPSFAAAKDIPPAPDSYVRNEGVISEAAAAEAGRRLRAFEERTGRQFVVGLFQSLEGEDLEGYENRLFKAWRVGQAKRDDGLLFCLFLKERRWRVEVGYGLEAVLTDLESSEIAQAAAGPHFKAEDYDGGVLAAIDALSAKLEGASETDAVRAPRETPDQADILWPLLWLVLGFFFVFAFTYERGFHWGLDDYAIGRRSASGPRYPVRALFLLWLYFIFLSQTLFWLRTRSLVHFRGAGWGGGGGWSSGGGGYSGGGGLSGGGGASGSW